MYHLDMKKREIETRERRRETLICTVKVDEIRAPLCHTDSTRWALQQSRVNHINVKTQWSKSFVQFWKVQFMLLFSCVALRIKEAFFFNILNYMSMYFIYSSNASHLVILDLPEYFPGERQTSNNNYVKIQVAAVISLLKETI